MKIKLKSSSDGFGSIILDIKYGDGLKTECFLNTKNYCFLCLDKIPHEEGDPPPATHNLEWVELHSRMVFRNVLTQNGIINDNSNHPLLPQLNEKEVNFNATVCSDCSSITDVLSMSCDPTVGIGIEHYDVDNALAAIQNKMDKVKESEIMDEFYKVVKIKPEQIEDAASTSIGRKFRNEIIRLLKDYLNNDKRRRMNTLEEPEPNTNQVVTIGSAEPEAMRNKGIIRQSSKHANGKRMMTTATRKAVTDNEHSGKPIPTQPLPSTSMAGVGRSRMRSKSVNLPKGVGHSSPNTTKPSLKTNAKGNRLNPLSRNNSRKPNSRRWECIFCGRFLPASCMADHIGIHTHERPFFCVVCGVSLKTKGSLKYHTETHNPNRQRKFSCHLCLRAFLTKGHLQLHQSTHNNDAFKSHPELVQHRNNSTVGPLQGNSVDKDLENQAKLDEHNRRVRLSSCKCQLCRNHTIDAS